MSLATAIGRFFPSLLPRSMQRAQPIEFSPVGSSFGTGIGLNPEAEVLLRECIGISHMATRAIANRVATIEPLVKITRRVSKGTTEDEILDDHPLKMLLDRPHPNLSRLMLLRLVTQWLVTVGEAHLLKVNNGFGLPTELHPIPPPQIDPLIEKSIVVGYEVRDGLGRIKTYNAKDIIRFYLPDPQNFFQGYGYLGSMANEADSLKFAAQHWRKHYQNDATPKSVIETDQNATQDPTPDEKRRFAHDWRERYHSRLGSTQGIPALLPMGYHLIEIATQTGANVVPLLEHWRDNMLLNYGVPRSVLGQVVSGDRSSAETNEWVFDLHTVTPLTDTIADVFTLQLARDFDRNVFVAFEDFVLGDKAFELQRDESDLKLFVRSINQVREDRGLDPVEWGEEPVATFGQTPYDWTGGFDLMVEPGVNQPLPDDEEEQEPEEDAEPEDEPRQRALTVKRVQWQRQVKAERKWQPAMLRAMRQVFKQQRDVMLERLRKMDEPRARASFALNDFTALFLIEEWAALFEMRVEPIREAAFREVLRETLSSFGIDEFNFTDEMRRMLRRQGASLVTWANATTQKMLAEMLEEGVAEGDSVDKIAGRISRVFNVRRKQARTIARTEVLAASSAANLAGYIASDVVEGKKWHTSLDDAVRDSHQAMEGVEVSLGQPFVVPTAEGGTELADMPRLGYQGSNMSAGNKINCRCYTTTILKE